MNLEVVSVETLRLVPTQPSSHHGELKRSVSAGNDSRVDAKPVATEVLLNQIMIEIALEKIAAQGLCGAEHVQSYLMDLYRRNCRPNTIRSRFATILVFLQYLKAKARNLLELLCREALCDFIEQEQDRGLKPASISCRIDALYAFIRFLVDREVLSPDLLKR
jgi:Phage integrase, N-terminal SAM-like domain